MDATIPATTPQDRLGAWLAQHKPLYQAAAKVGVAPWLLRAYALGRTTPGLKAAARIQAVVGIPATDWVQD